MELYSSSCLGKANVRESDPRNNKNPLHLTGGPFKFKAHQINIKNPVRSVRFCCHRKSWWGLAHLSLNLGPARGIHSN